MKSLHTNTRDETGFSVWKKAYNRNFLFQISPRLKIKFWETSVVSSKYQNKSQRTYPNIFDRVTIDL